MLCYVRAGPAAARRFLLGPTDRNVLDMEDSRLCAKRAFLEVSADIVEHVAPIFYDDSKAAAVKILGG